MKEILNIYQEGKTGYVDIYGAIVPDSWVWDDEDENTSATSFRRQLNKLDDVREIVVNINSPGGSVFEGLTIFNMLKNHKAKVIVNIDGLAASIASVIAMAGDTVKMPSNSMIMIHNAMTSHFGNAEQLRKAADDLDKVNQTVINSYLTKNPSIDQRKLTQLLDAESWLDANESLKLGLVDEVVREKEMVAQVHVSYLNQYNNTPKHLVNQTQSSTAKSKMKSNTQTKETISRMKRLVI